VEAPVSRIILILGGARSGKSHHAQELARSLSERVLYLAPAIPFDEDMRQRIEAHRQARPETWRTLETPYALADPLQEALGETEVVLLDCLTLLASNLLMQHPAYPFETAAPDLSPLEERLIAESRGVLRLVRERGLTLIVVSNEVGLGVVPAQAAGRLFRDLLGRANQFWAQEADEVWLMVAGIPVRIKG
jgi:adenosylcobinamide kinase/adenosylcobinamide-phosphate guanylyltransferase